MSYLSYKISQFLGGGLYLLLHITKNMLPWKTYLIIQFFTRTSYRVASSVLQQTKEKFKEASENSCNDTVLFLHFLSFIWSM